MNTAMCHIELTANKTKPTQAQTAIISGNFIEAKALSIATIKACIEQGKTIIPAALKSDTIRVKLQGAEIDSQQLFLVDIDSKDKKIAPSMEDMLTRFSDMGVNVCFAYPSFNWREDFPKYRIAICLDKPIHTKYEHDLILYCLFEVAGKQGSDYLADTNCINITRLFFGTCHKVQIVNDSATNTLEGIISAAQIALKKRGAEGCNTSRIMKSFCDKTGLEYVSKKGSGCSIKLRGNMVTSPSYKNIYLLSGDVTNRCQQNIDLGRVSEVCHLMRMFEEGIDFAEPDRKVLMSNLLHIRGGEKFYIDTVSQKYYKQYRHQKPPDKEVSYWKEHYNAPMQCKNCSHFEQCQPMGINILNSVRGFTRAKMHQYEKPTWISTETTRGDENCVGSIKHAYYHRREKGKINIISVDTGGGKTHFTQQLENIILATPTHAKALEISQDRARLGLDTIIFPDLKEHLTPKMKALYELGAVNEANLEIRQAAGIARKKPGMRTKAQKAFIEYVEAVDRLKNEDTTAVLTIARAVNMNDFYGREVIFDENPFDELKQIHTLNTEHILKALDKVMLVLPYEWRDILMSVTFQIQGKDSSVVLSPNKEENKQLRKSLTDYAQFLVKNGCANLFHILNAHSLYYTDSRILCYRNRYLPKECTIFSGTILEGAARTILGQDINYIGLGNIELKKAPTQYIGETYSRNYFDKINPDALGEIVQKHKGCKFITFKCFEEKLIELGIPGTDIKHFGAVEGLNDFAGRDLVIIGTPYVHPNAVQDYVRVLGKGDAVHTPFLRNVELNGYKFRLTTFDDELSRTLHLQMIWEQLQQAVGRARLVNYGCNVYIYAEFPIIGAKMVA